MPLASDDARDHHPSQAEAVGSSQGQTLLARLEQDRRQDRMTIVTGCGEGDPFDGPSELTTRDLLAKVARSTPPDKPARVLTEDEVERVLNAFDRPTFEDILNRALVACCSTSKRTCGSGLPPQVMIGCGCSRTAHPSRPGAPTR